MTTELPKAVSASGLSENAALDLLQKAGVISDLCLKLEDVADEDCANAVAVLVYHARRGVKGEQ